MNHYLHNKIVLFCFIVMFTCQTSFCQYAFLTVLFWCNETFMSHDYVNQEVGQFCKWLFDCSSLYQCEKNTAFKC